MENCINCNNKVEPEEICKYCGEANTKNNSRTHTLKSWLTANITLAPSHTLHRDVDVKNIDQIVSAVISATNKNDISKDNHEITFKLATLKELLKKELITEEEYSSKKDNLLQKLTEL